MDYIRATLSTRNNLFFGGMTLPVPGHNVGDSGGFIQRVSAPVALLSRQHYNTHDDIDAYVGFQFTYGRVFPFFDAACLLISSTMFCSSSLENKCKKKSNSVASFGKKVVDPGVTSAVGTSCGVRVDTHSSIKSVGRPIRGLPIDSSSAKSLAETEENVLTEMSELLSFSLKCGKSMTSWLQNPSNEQTESESSSIMNRIKYEINHQKTTTKLTDG